MTTTERPSGFVQSLERGLAVIRAFSAEHHRLTVTEVARTTGLTRAAAWRFLTTLEALGYVSTDGRYFQLRPKVLDLGYAFLSSFSLPEIAQSNLELLAEELHEPCSATVLDGSDVVFVARATTRRIMVMSLGVGRRLPAHASSMGRVLLAHLQESRLDEYLTNAPFERLTSRTLIGEGELREVLAQVRAQGWAETDQELEEGLRTIAVPVWRDGRVVAAVAVGVQSSRVKRSEFMSQYLPKLQITAQQITNDLARLPPGSGP